MANDVQGLVCAYHVDDQGDTHELDFDKVKKINEKPKGEGWYWIHLDIDFDDAIEWLKNYQGMLTSVAEALGSKRTRPRSYVFKRGILLISRGINLNPGEEAEDMLSVRIWMNDKIVITTRHEKLMAIDAIRKKIAVGKGPETPSQLVIQLIRGLIERITDKVEELDEVLSELEDVPEEEEPEELQEEVKDIRSTAITLLRHITPQKPALKELAEEETEYFSREERHTIRVLTSRVSGNIAELEAVRDRAEVIQEAHAARQTEQLNKTMYVLAIVSVFFLPMSLFTGLLGINVGGMPGEGWAPAFVIVLVLMAVMGYVTWVILKKLKFI